MLKYCSRKFVQLIVVMLLISFFSFAVIYFAPGDISSMYISADMDEYEKQLMKKSEAEGMSVSQNQKKK